MDSHDLYRAQFDCPHCRAVNSITANTLVASSRVVCSACHSEIGLWRDIVSLPRPAEKQKAT